MLVSDERLMVDDASWIDDRKSVRILKLAHRYRNTLMYYVLYIISRDAEARQHGTKSEFLKEGSESSQYETMRDIPRWQGWTAQAHLPSSATYREQSWPQRGSEAGEAELFKLFKTKVWEWTQNYRVWCLPCWVLVLPSSTLFSLCPHPLWNRNVFSVPLIVGALLCFCLSGVMDKRLPWALEETLDVWTVVRLLESMVTSEIGPNTFCIMRLALSLQGPGTECGHLSFMRRCDTGIFRLGKFILKSSNLLQNIDEWGGLMLHTPIIEIVL